MGVPTRHGSPRPRLLAFLLALACSVVALVVVLVLLGLFRLGVALFGSDVVGLKLGLLLPEGAQ